jgi:hypothetical protein
VDVTGRFQSPSELDDGVAGGSANLFLEFFAETVSG